MTKTYFIVNVTKKKHIKWELEKIFPKIEDLKEFVSPSDTVELVELQTTTYTYYGLNYDHSEVFSIKKERVNQKGDKFLTCQEKAIHWLNAKIKGTKPIFKPECSKCDDRIDDHDIRSIIDSGLCWKCRKAKKKKTKV